MEILDPLVERIAEEANLDPDYIEMLNILEADVPYEEIDHQSDLKMLKKDLPHMSIITFDSGDRLIVKNETEILIPKCQRSSDGHPMPWKDLLARDEDSSKEEI